MRAMILLAAVALAAAGADIRLVEGEFVLSPAPEQQGRQWTEVFSVRVETGAEVPPMSGSYRVEGGNLVFHPRYPLTGGMKYRAEAEGVSRVFEITALDQVFPLDGSREAALTAGTADRAGAAGGDLSA